MIVLKVWKREIIYVNVLIAHHIWMWMEPASNVKILLNTVSNAFQQQTALIVKKELIEIQLVENACVGKDIGKMRLIFVNNVPFMDVYLAKMQMFVSNAMQLINGY